MNCRDFQHKCNELLDAETPTGPAVDTWEDALREHAAGCDACRQFAARYHVLRHAIRAWIRTPQPAADLSDRILAAASAPNRSAWAVYAEPAGERMPWRLVASAAAAALFLAAVVLPAINRLVRTNRPDPPPAIGPVVSQDTAADLHAVSSLETGRNDHRGLQLALAEATSATWDLARSASEPAARISRDVLDATIQSEDIRSELRLGPAEAGVAAPVSIWIPQAPDAASASAVLQQVGDHLAAGVRPLSSTARHAFGFLLGPGPDRPGTRARRSTPRGA